MPINRTRRSLAVFALLCSQGGFPAFAQEPSFPSKPVHFVVGYSTGTGSDILARLLAQGLGPELGQSVIVENRPGGGGVIAAKHVAAAAPDGYTLMAAPASTIVTAPMLYSNATYRADKDFQSVSALARSYFVIAVANTPDAPKSLRELEQKLKSGEGTYGVSGVGGLAHLTAMRYLKAAGLGATMVPYPGGTQALSDVAAGHVLFSAETVAATMPLVRAGKLRAIAITADHRSAALPDVPTISENGYTDFSSYTWFAIMAPAKTPRAVLEVLDQNIKNVMRTGGMRDRLNTMGLEPMDMGLDEFDRFIASEMPQWREVTKDVKINP